MRFRPIFFVVCFLAFSLIGGIFFIVKANTATSPDGDIIVHPLNSQNSGSGSATSSSFNLDRMQVGDTTTNHSTDTGDAKFDVLQGHLYPEESYVIISSISVDPEFRSPATGNEDTQLILEIRDTATNTVQYKHPTLITTDTNGHWSGSINTGLLAGTYHVYVKGYSHLRRLLESHSLTAGNNALDFTSIASPNNVLFAGDTNNTTGAPLYEGDDTVNGVDMSVILNVIFETSSIDKEDLNQDGIVNGVDFSIALNHMFETGDTP